MAENFLTYIETDPNSRITVTSSRVIWADLTISEDARVYYDKGTDYFSGDFIHYLTVKMTSGTDDGSVYVWALTNTAAMMRTIDEASGSFLGLYLYRSGGTYTINIEECDGGSLSADPYTINLNAAYYLKIIRDESVPDHGRIYCYVYSDSARTNLLDTMYVTLSSSKKDFRYIFAVNTLGAGTTQKTSGYAENLSMVADITPVVTTQATSSIGSTTATGNGYIVQLGSSAVTEHGHCWNTTGTPTIGDSKKTNGAGTVGAFTSAITGLTPGTKYYVRAYATNTGGTSYGAGVSFVAGSGASQGRGGDIAIKETRFHYYGDDGIEYYIQGTAV